jgi:glycosyltransferase involved in cell wall biosynthesis
MSQDKTIVFVVHNYNTFQKDYIEACSKYFKKVYVLVRYKPLSKIADKLPVKWLNKYQDSKVIDLRDLPSNVVVIRTPVWYLPYGFFHKILGNQHLRSVDKVIQQRDIKFDIVHTHFFWSAGYVGMKLKEKYNVPFIATGHGYDVYDLPFKSKWWEKTIKEILQETDRVTTVSEENIKCIERLNIDLNKVELIRNGYNSDLFYRLDKDKVRKELNVPLDKEVLLSVGNLEPVKGHKYLIDAVKQLKKDYPDIVCYIVGEGSQRRSLENRISEYGLEDTVKLVGYVKHSEVNKWMNSCDIFVLPSLKESFGIVQLEAMACGKPIIATRTNGSTEVIKSEDYGMLCKKGDSTEIRSSISKALHKEWNKLRIIQYSQQFSWENISELSVDIYNELLNQEE